MEVTVAVVNIFLAGIYRSSQVPSCKQVRHLELLFFTCKLWSFSHLIFVAFLGNYCQMLTYLYSSYKYVFGNLAFRNNANLIRLTYVRSEDVAVVVAAAIVIFLHEMIGSVFRSPKVSFLNGSKDTK